MIVTMADSVVFQESEQFIAVGFNLLMSLMTSYLGDLVREVERVGDKACFCDDRSSMGSTDLFSPIA